MVYIMIENKVVNMVICSIVWLWLAFCCMTFYILHTPLWFTIFQNFPSALSKLNLQFPEHFWLDMICAIAMLALNGMVGMFFLRLFIRLPLLLEITANIFMGIGISNFLLMFPAIFFWLHPITILACYAVLLAILCAAKLKWGWSTQPFLVESQLDQSRLNTVLFYTALIIVVLITMLSFYHAVLFPVTYWDSLILYIHYGKMTYQQGGFPILYCLQVGLGLGANYPHLFPLYQAVTATVFNHWSDLYGQLLCPLAGLGASIVIYYLSIHLFQHRLSAILAVLAFRTIPYVNSYIVWASDYALIIVYMCLFLLFLRWFLLHPSWRMLQPLLCLAAIFPNINYLGWIVWFVVDLAVIVHYKQFFIQPKKLVITVLIFLMWTLIASTWYVRNYIVTGNPVYAFFPEILGGENINLEVLRSSELEWRQHGWGADHVGGETVWLRMLNTPTALLQTWHFAPVLLGIMLPSLLLGWKKKNAQKHVAKKHNAFFALAGVLVGLYVWYEYFISGFYWYHIIAVFPILAVFTARFLASIQSSRLYPAVAVCLILAGIAPGVSVSIPGTKHLSPSLEHFPHPGLTPPQFYKYVYARYASSWAYLNEHAEHGTAILSHDNRYHVLRDDLHIIHLDDCDLTPLYDQPYEEVHQALWDKGIRYYLWIEDETSHPITRRLGHTAHLQDMRYFELLHQTTYGQSITAAVYKIQPLNP